MDFRQVEPEVKRYLEKVRLGVKVDKAMIYGSIVREDAVERNDIDLLIISDDFSKWTFDERMKFLYRKSVGFPYDLHVYGVTTEEWREASSLTILGAIKNSKMVVLQ